MTKINELWHTAVTDRILQKARQLLNKAGGDVSEALLLCQRRDKHSPNSPGFSLGNFGYYTPKYRIQCMGNAPRNSIEAWAGPDHWDRPADLIVKWREVFEYAKNGARQEQLL